MKRITHEPAYVLHSYDWSESSLILEVFTRHHGRVALVAKGAKRPSSNFRPILLPLQALQIGYSGDGDIGTLKSAEWMGGHVMPAGDALLSGYYLNELLMRLLARDDPHATLFDAYAMTVSFIASHAGQGEHLQAALRAFELVLLREIGLLPALDLQTLHGDALQNDIHYILQAESGLRSAHDAERALAMLATQWQTLQTALRDAAPMQALLTLLVQQRGMALLLKNQLRQMLVYHCGVATLRTRQLMRELQSL